MDWAAYDAIKRHSDRLRKYCRSYERGCWQKDTIYNTAWAGNPARQVAQGVFFTGECVHKYKKIDTLKRASNKTKKFIYKKCKEQQLSFSEIDENIVNIESANAKLEYIQTTLTDKRKNRFFINTDNRISVSILKKCFK